MISNFTDKEENITDGSSATCPRSQLSMGRGKFEISSSLSPEMTQDYGK